MITAGMTAPVVCYHIRAKQAMARVHPLAPLSTGKPRSYCSKNSSKKATVPPVLLTPPLTSIRMGKDEPAQVCIPVTDLATHSIETTHAIAACFPNYLQVIPPEHAPVLEIMSGAELLLCVNAITQRLETAATGIEALLQPTKRTAKEPSADVQQAQGMTQAA